MNTAMMTVSAILVASVFVPFFVMNLAGTSSRKKLYNKLKTVANKEGLQLSEKEFWAGSYIGIDPEQQKLLYVHFEEEGIHEVLIDLTKVRDCKLVPVIKEVKQKTQKQQILMRVDLELHLADGKETTKRLNFYDYYSIYGEDFELKRAEKWKNLIQQHIPHVKIHAMAV